MQENGKLEGNGKLPEDLSMKRLDAGLVGWQKAKAKCQINSKLLPLKVLMLLVYGAMAALYPFLTLHMRSIGLSWTEIAIISAIFPFVSCIGPPLGGALADKIGNYKVTLMGFNIFSVIVHLLMVFAVPSLLVEQQVTNLNGTFSCTDGGNSYLTESVRREADCLLTGRAILWPNNPNKTLKFQHCEVSDNWDSQVESLRLCMGDSQLDCYSLPDMTGKVVFSALLTPGNDSWTLNSFTTQTNTIPTPIRCRTDSSQSLSVSCNIQTNFQATCLKPAAISNRMQTVAVYATFRFLAGIAVNTVIPILDAVAYKMSEDHGGDLGFQRIFSLIGMCVFPPLSGFLVGLASQNSGHADYTPAFYIFATMNLISVVVMLFMDLKLHGARENIWRNVGKILGNPKVAVFVLMMFLAGIAWGFLENYLFLFMDELGSPKWLLGMTNTVSALAAIPVVALSTYIMLALGHTKILMLCFLLYGVRFACYSITYNPFLILPVEVLEAFTTSLLWLVASVYCGKIAPDYLATLQGVIGAMHHAMGRGVGSLIGGIMFDKLKPRLTYQIFAVASGVVGVVYFILHYAWLRNIPNPQKDSPGLTPEERVDLLSKKGQRIRTRTLSGDDQYYLGKFARMEAFSRRYSLSPPVLIEAADWTEPDDAARYRSDYRRRRSTLVPSYFTVQNA